MDRCRLILETLENDIGHKEPASFTDATIEHVMPQNLSQEWKTQLGADAAAIHERWLDTFGNLTLTGYNSELSNSGFGKKKQLLADSHFEMNKAIAASATWDEAAIRNRALELFERAQSLWARPAG